MAKESCAVSREQLKEQIKNTLRVLYARECDLIQRGLHETCIVSYFWHYFKIMYAEEYQTMDIDMEYNKNGDKNKDISDKKSARPDIIIHRRTFNTDNFACFEFKKEDGKRINWDITKLKKFTADCNEKIDYTYGFKYGISIVLKKDYEAEIRWFEGGEEIKNEHKIIKLG